mgnify:CR=1 FL=1|tara:strand:+ start:1570 stop:1995 length:426 start_codon:yes stop_codon:yes gene_type:complete
MKTNTTTDVSRAAVRLDLTRAVVARRKYVSSAKRAKLERLRDGTDRSPEQQVDALLAMVGHLLDDNAILRGELGHHGRTVMHLSRTASEDGGENGGLSDAARLRSLVNRANGRVEQSREVGGIVCDELFVLGLGPELEDEA